MLHITCDLCGKGIGSDENHYVAKIEVFAANDPAELKDEDLDEDHMEAISQLLQEIEDGDAPPLEPTSHQLRYDLCPECRARYLKNPLQQEGKRDSVPKLHFSEN